jgi:MFS-type transporter involved in bile tolerance (Atg22 family)
MWDCASSDEGRFAMQLETPAAGRFAWALYDWANSPFTTLVITFVFPAYFQQGIVKDPVAGQALWGTAIAVSGILIAIGAPIAGAVADAAGRRSPGSSPSRSSARWARSRSGSPRRSRRRPCSA